MRHSLKSRHLWASIFILILFSAISYGAEPKCPPFHVFTGEAINDRFGVSVSGAGDVNNDGFADLIIGARLSSTGGIHSGRAYVYSGQTGALLHTFTGLSGGEFGGSVSGAGDVNNDGFADLIVGAKVSERSYVYSGQTGTLLYTFAGESVGDFFGGSVSGAGDVNLDGFADLMVGAHRNDAAGHWAGRAYVYSGQTGALLYTFTGEAADDNFGASVSGAGDVNNDGFADLIVGALGNDAGGVDAGKTYVYSGQSGALLYTFTGEAADDEFGGSVSGAGDVNFDGFSDFIVGAPGNAAGGINTSGRAAGRVYVYSGQNGALLHTITGDVIGGVFGNSVSGAGDIDADGFADLIIGAPWAERAYLYSGQTGMLLHVFSSGSINSRFGGSVSGAGDVNNDGTADIIVGERLYDPGILDTNVGRAYVYLIGGCCDPAGDANNDGLTNIADVTFLISLIFDGGPAPFCSAEADANGDGSVNISDVTFLIDFIF